MVLKRTLAVAIPAAAAALFLAGPTSALADSSGGHGHGHTVQFSATGTGAATETTDPASPVGCQFGGTCIVDTTGPVAVTAGSYTFAATYSSQLFIDYAQVSFPTPTTYCAPAQGTVTITSDINPSDQIFKSEQGQVCGGTAPYAPHTFNGTYQITGGSGQFNGASGSGTVTSADNGIGQVTSSQESGTIAYPGAHGTGDGEGGPS